MVRISLSALLQVVLLMLIPLLAPSEKGFSVGLIAKALGFAGLKATAAILGIVTESARAHT